MASSADVQADAFDARGRAGEVLLDQRLVQADGFEHLRAAIALQRGDAHLGKSLQQALVDGLDEVVQRFRLDASPVAPGLVDGFERQVGVHRAGAIADQQGEVHDLARLAGFDDQGHLRAGFLAHQVVVHGGQRQQAGDGGIIRVHAAVGENQQRVARLNGQRGAAAELRQRALQALAAVVDGEEHGQRGGQKIALRHAAQLFQIAIGEDGCGSLRVWQCCGVSSRMLRSVPM